MYYWFIKGLAHGVDPTDCQDHDDSKNEECDLTPFLYLSTQNNGVEAPFFESRRLILLMMMVMMMMG